MGTISPQGEAASRQQSPEAHNPNNTDFSVRVNPMVQKFHITPRAAMAIQKALSQARLAEYLHGSHGIHQAIELYQWNAEVSAALMVPLHCCEVVLRNGVSEALDQLYGDRWYLSNGFRRSLELPKSGYDPAADLQLVTSRHSAKARIIGALKFVFWETLLTHGHERRLWKPHLHRVFPNLNPSRTVGEHRRRLHADVGAVRRLRNKVAHHEALISRDLRIDLERICGLVGSRCGETEQWLRSFEGVTALLSKRP